MPTLSMLVQKEIFQKNHLNFPHFKHHEKYYSPRECYGALVSSNRAALIVVLFEMLKEINPEVGSLISAEDLLHLQLISFFACSAWDRTGTEVDWVVVQNNARAFLESIGISRERALSFSHLLSDERQTPIDERMNYLLYILVSAHQLVSMRNATYLFQCSDIPLIEEFNRHNQEGMIYELATNILDLIITQDDLPHLCQIKNLSGKIHYQRYTNGYDAQKKHYEHAPDIYQKVVHDFSRFPVLKQYYRNDALTSDQEPIFRPVRAQLQREEIRSKASIIRIKDDFLIKSLRGDKDNYFLEFLDGVTNDHTHHPLRRDNKKIYTVDGRGIHLRSEKKPKYAKDVKNGYSKKQAASYGMPDYHPVPFHFSQEQIKNMGIILFNLKNNVLLSDLLSIHDFGSVGRPNDFNLLPQARYYAKTIEDSMFPLSRLEEFRRALKENETGRHNEVLARLRWTPDEHCQLFINVDTLESRLLAQVCAQALANRLVLPGYKPRICYYMPHYPSLHLRQYTPEEQQMDLDEAALIPDDPELITHKARNNDFEFLLITSPSRLNTMLQVMVDGKTLLTHILQAGLLHLLDFFVVLKQIEKTALDALWRQVIDRLSVADELFIVLYQSLHKGNRALFDCALSRLSSLPDAAVHLNKPHERGTILQWSLFLNRMDYFYALLHHPDINLGAALNDSGENILHYALDKGRLDAVIRLVALDLDINQPSKKNLKPIDHAVLGGKLEVVRFLLKQPNLELTSTQHLLRVAVQGGYVDILQCFQEDGRFDFNQPFNDGETLLQMTKNPLVLEFLLQIPGMDFLRKNPDNLGGGNLLHVAANGGHLNLVALLLEKGIPVQETNCDGETALHLVIRQNCRVKSPAPRRDIVNIIQLLLQAGIDKEALDESGYTALELAIQDPQGGEMVKVLLDSGCSDEPRALPDALIRYGTLRFFGAMDSQQKPISLENEAAIPYQY